jgi:hypothetical protein
MKANEGVNVYIHVFLTSALAGGEWSASRAGRFTPGERARGTLEPTGTQTPTSSVVQPVASRYTEYAVSAPFYTLCKEFRN